MQLKEPLSIAEYKMIYRNEMALPGLNSFVLRCNEGVTESQDPLIFKQSYLFNGYPETMFYDGVHYIPKSARLVGNDIAEKITPLLKESFKN